MRIRQDSSDNWASLARGRISACLSFAFCLFAFPASGQEFLADTRLVEARMGSSLSSTVRKAEQGGYRLARGGEVRFSDWYSTSWQDLRLTWITALSKDLGIYWGFGTGERGGKYEIDPSLKLGFLAKQELDDGQTLMFAATTVLWGRLSEDSCIADYGAIGGVQEVNCRLAATPLPPADTLEYLYDAPPADRFVLSLTYDWRF
ncbi:hypothetical protein O2N63_07210 [Aliiroseovarius sp. KMU-50]|uniref:DUF481 domain-containing protein n=1 Tax=Aliiroseovarius salicola TaxID=3009082 RepID=A0ABT4W240_9RHOB|nr:hypothetical protein [Aliiroseovarius sp. KMU-50]MDA5093872.1 hypothetical protein [Aliiroseovarius sp. KMU-50]